MTAILEISNAYKLMAMAHILCAVIAFGPLLLYPTLQRAGSTAEIARSHMTITFPALVVLWVLGMGLAGMSEKLYRMSQTWLALSLINWAILVAVSWFLIRPSLGDPSESAQSKLSAGIGINHLGLVIGLALMIWKPGL